MKYIDFEGDVFDGEAYPGAIGLWVFGPDNTKIVFSMKPRIARKLALRIMTMAREAEQEGRKLDADLAAERGGRA